MLMLFTLFYFLVPRVSNVVTMKTVLHGFNISETNVL